MEKRYLTEAIVNDLNDKMIFLGGPRQVGKTTLAESIGKSDYLHSQYLNWDNLQDREIIISYAFQGNAKLLIFDELHKYKDWKNHIKGIFDKYKKQFHMMITGSARLDLYRKGGDSLQGRYFYYRLHPFSIAELVGNKFTGVVLKALDFPDSSKKNQNLLNNLWKFGAFPEPLFKQKEVFLKKWQNNRLDRLVKEDIRDTVFVRDLSSLQLLTNILPSKVASLLSINSLTNDLQVTFKTVSAWIEILENFYYHFRIYPFQSSLIKSLRKEPKLYLWDYSQVKDEGAKFENLIASHLLKFVHYLYDTQGQKAQLYFLRDQEGREMDFLVTIDEKPWFSVEVKLSDTSFSKQIKYFSERLKIPFNYQVVMKPDIDFLQNDTRVISADKFLSALV